MSRFSDIISFRFLLTPILFHILFWAAIGGNLYGTWWLYSHDNWAWIMSLTFGTIGIRVIFEGFILKFKSYETLLEIKKCMTDTKEISTHDKNSKGDN